jgi:hypothetical protein
MIITKRMAEPASTSTELSHVNHEYCGRNYNLYSNQGGTAWVKFTSRAGNSIKERRFYLWSKSHTVGTGGRELDIKT